MRNSWRRDSKKFWEQALNSFQYKLDYIEGYFFSQACTHFQAHRDASFKGSKHGWFCPFHNGRVFSNYWELAQTNWDSFINVCDVLQICNPDWKENPWPISPYFVPVLNPALPGFQRRDPTLEGWFTAQLQIQEWTLREFGVLPKK